VGGEVAESARPVRGRDVNELQPASIDAQPSESSVALNSPSPGGGREGAAGGFSASEHSSTTQPTASPARLLAPRQREVGGEVAESRLEGGRPVRGRDVNELQPASIDAQPNESNSPSQGGEKTGFAEARIVPRPSLPTHTTPPRPPQTPKASSRPAIQFASPAPAATVPP
jgi:hypothetical protein